MVLSFIEKMLPHLIASNCTVLCFHRQYAHHIAIVQLFQIDVRS
jgi:hypothetical protein